MAQYYRGIETTPAQAATMLEASEVFKLSLVDKMVLSEIAGDAHPGYNAFKQNATHYKSELCNNQHNYINTLPPVPYGYYIANCADPEGPCIGWHCYAHQIEGTDCSDPIGGHYQPTAYHYCDGGAPLTLAWVVGTLPVVPQVE